MLNPIVIYRSFTFATALLVALVLTRAGVASDAADSRWTISGNTMGPVPFSVVIVSPPAALSQDAAKATISAALERVNSLMSTYQAESDVSRFNRSTSTDWFAVDLDTAQVIQRALEISALTDGAFDVRVAAAVERWNFGPNKTSFQLPSAAEISELKQSLDSGELEARIKPPAIRKTNQSLKIDLSAIAKGYAADKVADALRISGCENVMVEVGGEVFANGYRSGTQPWRIGIEQPSTGPRKIEAKVALSSQGMATSGNYRNYFLHQGQHYSHTIDPETCRPVTHFLASATVVAEDCMTADALATAVMVLGEKKGHGLAKRVGFELFTIDRQGGFEGEQVTRATEGFPIYDPASETASLAGLPSKKSIWPTFVGALLVFSIAIIGMAIGAIFANKPVRGSCGGLSAMSGAEDEDGSCSVCAKPVSDCVDRQPESEPS